MCLGFNFDSVPHNIGKCCIITDREQGTGNREQGTGNREQGTGNREQGTGNREQGTGNREQGTGNREQGTGNREQGTRLYKSLDIIKNHFHTSNQQCHNSHSIKYLKT